MSQLSILRKAGIAEGISFLVLLLIAMPLKYFFQQPMAVKIAGWIHGFLFVLFIGMAWAYKDERHKPFKWFVLAGIAALVPLGTFWFDKSLRKEEPRTEEKIQKVK
jgi:integral membrane protein